MSHISTVFIAKPELRRFFSALHDLSSIGMANPFGWIEISDFNKDNQADICVDGEIHRVSFYDVLNQASEFLNLIDLRVIGENFSVLSQVEENEFSEKIRYRSGITVNKIRLVVPWDNSKTDDFTHRLGWRTLVISPEICSEPTSIAEPWWKLPDKREATVVSAIAGICNIWKNGEDILSELSLRSDDIRVVKIFSRGVTSVNTHNQLKYEIFKYTGDYTPLIAANSGPNSQFLADSEIPIVSDSVRAVQEMAGNWWQMSSPYILQIAYPAFPNIERPTIGFWEAIKQYFSFLIGILVNAPKSFAQSIYHDTCRNLAGIVQNTVYGTDANIRVLAGGVDAEGHIAGWKEIVNSINLLKNNPTFQRQTDLSQAPIPNYKEAITLYREGALCLADGSKQRMSAIHQGQHPTIVAKSSCISPEAEDWQINIHGYQAKVSDPIAVDTLREILRTRQRSAQSADFDTFSNWARKVDSTYTGACMRIVSQQFMFARSQAAQALSHLEQLQAQLYALTNSASNTDSEKAIRYGKIVSIVFLILLVCTGIAGWYFSLKGLTIALLSVLQIIIWMLLSMVFFSLHQRSLTQTRFHEEQLRKLIPYWERVLFVAGYCQERLIGLVSIFDIWAPVIAEFIHHPFGRGSTDIHVKSEIRNLGDNVVICDSYIPHDKFTNIAYQQRLNWLNQGWANRQWLEIEARLPEMMDSIDNRARFINNPARLFDLPPTDIALQEMQRNISNEGLFRIAKPLMEERLQQIANLPELVSYNGEELSLDKFIAGFENNQITTMAKCLNSGFANTITGKQTKVDNFETANGVNMVRAFYMSDSVQAKDLAFIKVKQTTETIGSESLQRDFNF